MSSLHAQSTSTQFCASHHKLLHCELDFVYIVTTIRPNAIISETVDGSRHTELTYKIKLLQGVVGLFVRQMGFFLLLSEAFR